MGIVLLVLGAFYFIRRPKIMAMRAEDWPSAPPMEFERWRILEVRSIDVFLVATWGTTALGFVVGLVLGQAFRQQLTSPDQAIPIQLALMGGQVVVFLVGLVISSILGSQAARLRKTYGITLPK